MPTRRRIPCALEGSLAVSALTKKLYTVRSLGFAKVNFALLRNS